MLRALPYSELCNTHMLLFLILAISVLAIKGSTIQLMIFSETDAGKHSIEKQEANVAEGYNDPPPL